jgi:protocatechuate 3,4-dioxygenase beta subunit
MLRIPALPLLPLLLLAHLPFLAGCEDESPAQTSFSGTLILVDDESPLPDLEVTLFEPASQTAVARDVTDSLGRFEFEALVPGTYIPVVHANGFRPVFLPKAKWMIEHGDQIDIELRMRHAARVTESDFRLAGKVVDRETGDPIVNARVEMNFVGGGEVTQVNWSEYVGWATTLEDTTDEEGDFWLAPVTLFALPPDFTPAMPEVRITAPGYRSLVLERNTDPKTANASFVTASMTPGTDSGSIEGKVLDLDGKPVGGVRVSAEWRQQLRFARGFTPVEHDNRPTNRILLPDGVGWTDATGQFRITGLPRGFFSLMAGAEPDDGWVGIVLSGVEIATDDGSGEAELISVRAIDHTSPPDGAVLDVLPDRLIWKRVKGAVSYLILVTRGSDGNIGQLDSGGPFFEIDPGEPLFRGGGSFAWNIIAFAGDGGELSVSDRPFVFHLPLTED